MAVVLWTGKNRSKPVGIGLCSVCIHLSPGPTWILAWAQREDVKIYGVFVVSVAGRDAKFTGGPCFRGSERNRGSSTF